MNPNLRLDRLGRELGELVEVHSSGLGGTELRRLYAALDGGPDPEGFAFQFCPEQLGLELTPQQVEGARELAQHQQVMVCGANGTGKDTLTAAWSLYELFVLGAEVLISGPTLRQVRETLMRREIGRYFSRAKGRLQGERFELAIRLPGAEDPALVAFTATDPEHFKSHHSARLFIAITEAQAVPAEIIEAAQQCLPTTLLLTCNTTTPACAAYGLSRSPEWHTLTWSALEHINVTSGEVKIPGAITREAVQRWRREKGEGSRFWKVSVLAQWPEEGQNPLFIAARWDEAVERGREVARHIERERGKPRAVIAADIAGSGTDETALFVRIGWCLWRLVRWRESDSQRNAERIFQFTKGLLDEGILPDVLVVDEIGEGRGVYDKLLRLLPAMVWYEAGGGWSSSTITNRSPRLLGFKSSRQANNPARYVNLRAESYDFLGQRLEEGDFAIHPDVDPDLLADLREELLAHEITFQGDERLLIAPKDEIRAMIGRSPDLADAAAMSMLPAIPVPGKKKYTAKVW